MNDSRGPRVVFIARSFPPVSSPAVVRARNMAVQLARRGWRVTAVTVPETQLTDLDPKMRTDARHEVERWGIDRVEAKHWLPWLGSPCDPGLAGRVPKVVGAIRRVARRVGIDSGAGWAGPVRRACSQFSPGDVDVVLATGSPFAAFLAGRDVAGQLRCPLVLDYRDSWNDGPHDRRPSTRSALRDERLALDAAALVLCVSPSLAQQLSEKPEATSKLRVLTNGFDAEECAAVTPARYDHTALVYTGSFVLPIRTATPLMKSLARAEKLRDSSKPPLRLHYFGNAGAHVAAEANQANVAHLVEVHGERPRSEALAAVKGASLAIVVASVRPESSRAERGIVTGKLFEAIGLRTPVLLVAPTGSDAAAVLSRVDGGRSFVGDDVENMARYIANLEPASIDGDGWEQYSWTTTLGARLDGLLRETMPSSAVDR